MAKLYYGSKELKEQHTNRKNYRAGCRNVSQCLQQSYSEL